MIKQGKEPGNFHRLNRLRLRIPPLRERKEDIPEILKKILKREHTGNDKMTLEPDAIKVLMDHPFPGNVRELETYVHRLQLINGKNGNITVDKMRDVLEPVDIPSVGEPVKEDSKKNSLKLGIENMERDKIRKTLEENKFNITKTAEVLGISRQGLHNKIKRYKLPKR